MLQSEGSYPWIFRTDGAGWSTSNLEGACRPTLQGTTVS